MDRPVITSTHLVQADTLEEIGNVDSTPPTNGQVKKYSEATGKWENSSVVSRTLDLGGIWGLQNNEVNAIALSGVIDTNHTQDIGNSGAMGTPTDQAILNSNSAGGWLASFDCRIVNLLANYEQNGAADWGFLIFKQVQVSGADGGNGFVILDDVANNVNRQGASNISQIIDHTDFEPVDILRGEMICLAARCPTTAANRNMRIKAGHIELQPI